MAQVQQKHPERDTPEDLLRAEAFALGRLMVREIVDPIDVLLVETIEIDLQTPAGISMRTSVYAPTARAEELPGSNPTGVPATWADIEAMVVETWKRLAGHEHLAGTTADIWFNVPCDYGTAGVFVRFKIDADNNRWRFIDACRSAIELAR